MEKEPTKRNLNLLTKEEKENLLYCAVESGIIDLQELQDTIEMSKRKELLAKHPYKIWESNDNKWYTYLPDKTKGRILKKRSTQEAIEDIVVQFWKAEIENPSINEVFQEWNDRRLELKKISSATHLRNQQIFNRHYKEFGKKRIKSVDAEEFGDFLEEQIPKYDLTAKAFSNLKGVTRGFLKRAKKRKLIDFNVEEIFQELDTSETDFKKVRKEDCKEVFNEAETVAMKDYLTENKDLKNLGLLLLFVTGMRVGELATLKWSDYDGKDALHIQRTETRYSDKDGKCRYEVKESPKTNAGNRVIIIPKDFLWIMKILRMKNPFGEYVFEAKGQRIKTYCFRKRLDRNCKALGFVPKSPHKIRKTYGSILLDNHVDNKLIVEMMGHVDILCTENYYHRNRRSNERKSEILSAIPEFMAK